MTADLAAARIGKEQAPMAQWEEPRLTEVRLEPAEDVLQGCFGGSLPVPFEGGCPDLACPAAP